MHGTAHSVPDDLSPPSLRTLSVTIYDATHNAGIGLHLRYMVGRVRLQASLPCPLQLSTKRHCPCPRFLSHVWCSLFIIVVQASGNFAMLPRFLITLLRAY